VGNLLYYGDNLDILRRYVADESVDLVYLDPPFNSNATYNVLFAEQGGAQAASQIILSVKAGHTGRHHVHELRGVIEREGAAIGVLITMPEPTKPMREDAAAAGFYHAGWEGQSAYPRIQLLTVAKLLDGSARIESPVSSETNVTFKKAPKTKSDESTPLTLDLT
jgi:hypothetical protein